MSTAAKYPDTRWLIYDTGAVGGQFASWRRVVGEGGKIRIYHDKGSLPYQKTRLYETKKDLESITRDYPAFQFHVIQAEVEFDDFMDLAYKLGGSVVVVDEIDLVSSNNSMPPWLSRLVNAGAHAGRREGEGKFGGGLSGTS